MPTRSRKPSDFNSLAASIVGEVAGESPPAPKKNPHAVALGRKGGKKGGAARAKALTPQRKREIAQSAAKARWGTKETPSDRDDGAQ